MGILESLRICVRNRAPSVRRRWLLHKYKLQQKNGPMAAFLKHAIAHKNMAIGRIGL